MPDFLPPVVVLETLRHGRQRVVIGLFLLTQLLLAFMVAAQVMSPDATAFGAWFWMVAIVAVLVATPLLAAWRSVDTAADNCTHELMVVARLSSWQQVTGQWLATCLLSAALLVSLVPWLMVRWLALGVSIDEEWLALGLMTLFAPVLNALWVGVPGASGGALARALPATILGASVVGAWHLGGGLMRHGRDVFGGQLWHATSYPQFVPALALLPGACLLLLWLASSRLARDHETPTIQGRVAVVVMLLLIGALDRVGLSIPSHSGLTIIGLLIIAACHAAIDRPRTHPRIRACFSPQRLASRWAARALAPGNHSAGVFMLLLVVTATAAWPTDGALGLTRWPLAAAATAGMAIVLWGVIIDRLMFKHHPPTPTRMLAIQAVIWSVSGLAAHYDALHNHGGMAFAIVLPPTMFFNLLGWPFEAPGGLHQVQPLAIAAALVWAAAGLWVDYRSSQPWWRTWWLGRVDRRVADPTVDAPGL